MSSSLDSLKLSAAVAHTFVCKRQFDGFIGGGGVGCVSNTVDTVSFCRNFGELLLTKRIISLVLDLRHGHSAKTCSMDLQIYISKTCSMDIQHWNGHAAQTYIREMHPRHAAWNYSISMQHVHVAPTCCMRKQKDAACTCSIDIHLRHAAMAWSMDMQ